MSQISFSLQGAAGIVALNRPEALNALSMEMLEALHSQLTAWQSDEGVKLVIITSTSPRAFCAGGDVLQAVSEIKQANGAPAAHYFKTEYGIHAMISAMSKPVISLVDGIIMGGGLGLARNSGTMVISDTIRLAMPETAIGLFPDVAANIFLRRAGLPAALMLGMTGTIIGAGDALAWGLADHHVPAAKFDALTTALSAVSDIDEIAGILADFEEGAPKQDLSLDIKELEICFSGPVENIVSKLSASAHPSAEKWLSALETRCPTSIVVFHHLLHQAPPHNIEAALDIDFKLALNMTARPDFVEGVRAILIDKDGRANWSPARLAEIDASLIETLFDFDGLPDLQDASVST